MARPLPLVAFLGILLGGCAASPSTPAPLSSAPATADADEAMTDENQTASRGVVQGAVVDDEMAPIEGATVVLLGFLVEVRTDPAGAFEFRQVPVGDHGIQAYKPGYESQTRNVTVVADEATRVELALKSISVDVPHIENLPRTIYHHYGINAVDSILNSQTGGSNPGCEGCIWAFKFERPPEFLLLEIFGTHSVTNPTGPAKEYVDLRTADPVNKFIIGAAMTLPVRYSANATQLFNDHAFELASFCDSGWVCYEERRDLWASGFHFQTIPEGYTAMK